MAKMVGPGSRNQQKVDLAETDRLGRQERIDERLTRLAGGLHPMSSEAKPAHSFRCWLAGARPSASTGDHEPGGLWDCCRIVAGLNEIFTITAQFLRASAACLDGHTMGAYISALSGRNMLDLMPFFVSS